MLVKSSVRYFFKFFFMKNPIIGATKNNIKKILNIWKLEIIATSAPVAIATSTIWLIPPGAPPRNNSFIEL